MQDIPDMQELNRRLVVTSIGTEEKRELKLGKIFSITSMEHMSQAHFLAFCSPIVYGRRQSLYLMQHYCEPIAPSEFQ